MGSGASSKFSIKDVPPAEIERYMTSNEEGGEVAEDAVSIPFEDTSYIPITELDPLPDDVLSTSTQSLQYHQFVDAALGQTRRVAFSSPPLNIEEALSYVPLAMGKRDSELVIIQRVFAEHIFLRSVDPEPTRILINAMEREEISPGTIICNPKRTNKDLIVICRGTLMATPNVLGLQRTGSLASRSSCDRWSGEEDNLLSDGAVEYVPGEVLFATHLLYPEVPREIVRAGEEGATVYRLRSGCFKNVMAKLNLRTDRKHVTVFNAFGAEGQDAPASGAETLWPVPLEEYLATRSNNVDALEPLQLLPVASVGQNPPLTGDDVVWEQPHTAILMYAFPAERRMESHDTRLLFSASDTMELMTDVETVRMARRPRYQRRRYAVVSEYVDCDDQFRPTPYDKSLEVREALHRLVQGLSIFAHITPPRLNMIVDSFQRVVVKPGEPLPSSHEFYWIESGTIVLEKGRISSAPSDDESFRLPGYGQPPSNSCSLSILGNTLKEAEDILSDDSNGVGTLRIPAGRDVGRDRLLRMYNERVDGDPLLRAGVDEKQTVLWTICRGTLRRILVADALRTLWRRLQLLGASDTFSSLTAAERWRVADALVPISYPRDTCLLAAEAEALHVFLIESGTVEVTTSRALRTHGQPVHVNFIGRAACVGAAEALGGSFSPFDHRAHSEVTGFTLPRHVLTTFLPSRVLERLSATGGATARRRQQDATETLRRQLEDACDAAPDSGSECDFTDDMCPVEVKEPVDDAFLHAFLSNGEYATAKGMQRGLAVAAFRSPLRLECGETLFKESDDVAPSYPNGSKPSSAMSSRIKGRTKRHERDAWAASVAEKPDVALPKEDDDPIAHDAWEEQFLYVIAGGTVTLSHHSVPFATVDRGFSVGAEILVRPRGAAVHSTATVTSATCVVYRLDRKSFRRLLMPVYVQHARERRGLLATAPFSSRLSHAALAALSRRATATDFQPAQIILPQGSTVGAVLLVLEGTVEVTRGCGEEVLATLSAGDLIGALELTQRRAVSVACYAAQTRLRTLRIPADVFEDSFMRFDTAVKYLRELQRTERYAFYESQLRTSIDVTT